MIFTANWTKLHYFDPSLPQVPDVHCTYVNTSFTGRLGIGNETQVYRVPHSRIIVDGAPCGSLGQNASDDELFLDNYMLLTPGKFLLQEDVANSKGLGAMRRDLFDQGDRHGLAMTAFRAFSDLGLDMWVGYEAISDRVCAGKTILSRTSFTIFFQTQGSLDIGSFLSISAGSKSLVYDTSDDVMMTFDEPFSNKVTPDKVCPSSSTQKSILSEAQSSTSCFPANARVSMQGGATKYMADLEVGDKVKDSDSTITEVFMFTHRDRSSRLHPFVQLSTADSSLTASAGHYVHTLEGLTPAGMVAVGSWLIRDDGSYQQVLRKEIVHRRGLYNPQTASGSLIVDGFSVSTYTTAIKPEYAHAFLHFLRKLYTYSGQGSMLHRWLSDGFSDGASKFPVQHIFGADLQRS